MPIPSNLNEWEFLQDQIRLWHNKKVNRWFKGQRQNEIETPKEKLRHACLIKDDDTDVMTLMRLWLFEITAGHAQSVQTSIYGIPVQELQRDVTFKPQIKLVFRESLANFRLSDRNRPAQGEITIRLMNESSDTISRAEAERLATKIKEEFARPVFVWNKGTYKCTYSDSERGYQLKLLVISKSEGIRVIKQVLKIQNHPYNDDYLQYIDHDRVYPLNPGTHRVYGQTISKPVKRPVADVRFKYAQLLIWGRANAINLVAMADVGFKSVIQRVFDS